jgi:WD40 repeat protein
MNKGFTRISCELEAKPSTLAFHPSEPLVFIGDRQGHICVFDLNDGAKIHRLKVSKGPIHAIGFYNGFVYAIDAEKYLVKWDLKTFKLLSSKSLSVKEITQVAFSPHDPFLVVACDENCGYRDSVIYRVDVESLECTGNYNFNFGDLHWVIRLIFSKDGTQLFASALSVGVETAGDYSICATYFVTQWNLGGGDSNTCFFGQEGYPDYLTSTKYEPRYAFSTNGQKFLAYEAFESESFQLWKAGAREPEEAFSNQVFTPTAMDWSPLADQIAFGNAKGQMGMFDLDSKELLWQESFFDSQVQYVGFSADGRYLAAFSEDRNVEIIELKRQYE